MMIIADSGSTKTDWIIVDENQKSISMETKGVNPFFQNTDNIYKDLENKFAPKVKEIIKEVYFYGAGCLKNETDYIVKDALIRIFPNAKITVEDDMLGAARAVLINKPGIACILGTGANSCQYDGENVVDKVPTLGFILGDEGSGAYLGKIFLNNYFKRAIPADLRKKIDKELKLEMPKVLSAIYREEYPGRKLAEFSNFFKDNIQHPYIQALVRKGFDAFLSKNVEQYEGYQYMPVSFVGSIAFYYSDFLQEVAKARGITIGAIIKKPIEGLKKYHTKEQTHIKVTEAPSLYDNLDKMSVREILSGINQEDSKVHIAVKREIPKIEQLVVKLVKRIKAGGRLFYLGAGTSGRLGIIDASEIPPTYGMPQGVVIGLIAGGDKAIREAVEAAEDDAEKGWKDMESFNINKKDTVIGIAASGGTPYVIGGLKDARKMGLLTACITCNPNTEISKAADIAIEAIVGPEFVTGSTRMKAGTAQKLVLNMITTSLMIRLGRVKGNRMVDMQLTNQKLVERGTKMIEEELGINEDEARRLLLLHGSVRAATDSFNEIFLADANSKKLIVNGEL